MAQLSGSGRSVYPHISPTSVRESRLPLPHIDLESLNSAVVLAFLRRSSLTLGAMGWDVLATDLPGVISYVLFGNISRNIPDLPSDSGRIQVRVLNWTVPPDEWAWDNDLYIAATAEDRAALPAPQPCEEHLEPPFDMIISADTLYDSSLVDPLMRTLHTLSTLSLNASKRAPPIYLCIERRDPALIDQALSSAKDTWNFTIERVSQRKVVKAMERSRLTWQPEDWDGIEIWKMNLNLRSTR